MNPHHRAHLPRFLRIYTAAVVVLILAFAVFEAQSGRLLSALGLVMIIILGGALRVQGYTIVDGKLFIHRGGWDHTFDLTRLRHVEASPGAMQKTFSLWSTRGFFGIAGWMWNKSTGRFRAYATDPAKAVTLDLGDERVVVTPEEPESFVEAVRAVSTGLR